MAEFSKEDTIAKVIQIVSEKIKIDKTTISQEANLQDLGADSLDLVEITMKLEEEFGMEISDDDAENLTAVGQIIDYIHTRRTK